MEESYPPFFYIFIFLKLKNKKSTFFISLRYGPKALKFYYTAGGMQFTFLSTDSPFILSTDSPLFLSIDSPFVNLFTKKIISIY